MKKTPEALQKVKLPELTVDLPKDYLEVCCPSCDNTIVAADMNIHDKVAKCGQCNVLFPIHNEINSLSQTLDLTPVSVSKAPVNRPVGIDIFRYKGELDFTYQEMRGPFLVIASLSLLLFASLSTFLFLKGEISIWFPISLWIPAILTIIYASISTTSTLNIDGERLTIKKRPKKMSKDQVYLVQEIDQLYTKLSSDTASPSVYAIINSSDGQKHVHLASFNTRSKAQYLEQEIEDHLGIPDRPVPEAS